jgi:hypothetical protein
MPMAITMRIKTIKNCRSRLGYKIGLNPPFSNRLSEFPKNMLIS